MSKPGAIKPGEVRNPTGYRERRLSAFECQKIVREMLASEAQELTSSFLKIVKDAKLDKTFRAKIMWPVIEALGGLKNSSWLMASSENDLSASISALERNFGLVAQENLRLKEKLESLKTQNASL